MNGERSRMPTLPAPPDSSEELPERIRSRLGARRADATHFAAHAARLEHGADGLEVACLHLRARLLDKIGQELSTGSIAQELRALAEKARAAAVDPPLEEDVWANAAIVLLHARLEHELAFLRQLASKNRDEAKRTAGMLLATEDELAHLHELQQLLDGPGAPVVPFANAPVVGPGSVEQPE